MTSDASRLAPDDGSCRSSSIVVIDREGTIHYASPSHKPILGYEPEALIGRYAFGLVHPEDAAGLERIFRRHQQTGIRGLPTVLRFKHADGSWCWLEAVASVAPNSVGVGIVVNSRDVSERKASEAALEHLALHDGLTQLPNRTLLHDRLSQALNESARSERPTALLVLDLNRFKEINDTLGHHVGDGVLAVVAERLVETVRKSDTVARLGGDEFAVVLPGADSSQALAVANTIKTRLERPIEVEGNSLLVAASVGIAVAPEHGTETSDLLRKADVAMYQAKRTNSAAATYSVEHDYRSAERLMLASDLRQAIADGGLELHYQLKAALGTGSHVGVEALVRWRHAERGSVPPDAFIPVAEETGLIQPLTHWVLATALDQLRNWLDAGLDLSMAINVSVRNLNENSLPELVADLLCTHNIPAHRVLIEVTESSLMTDPGRAVSVLSRLREMGLAVAIDDFGTGYSSLAYLKRLPVDELKIDRSFVRDLAHDRDDTAIVRTTIELGHELGLTVVAEGIEDQATWDRLSALGCDVGQGFFLARPEPAASVTARLLAARETGASLAA
jgi:diguanylate cyclase